MFLSKTNLKEFLEKLSLTYEVYVPVKKGEQRFYSKYSARLTKHQLCLGEVRPFEPLKAFFSRAREIIARDFQPDRPHTQDKPFAIVGVKACDLKGFKIQDFVFKDSGCKDPAYTQTRERNLIISTDCTLAIDTCYCLALGIQPHPQENFDINLSETSEGFVVEIGSEKGRGVTENLASLFKQEIPEAAQAEKNSQRDRVIRAVEENIRKFDIPRQESFAGIIERNFQSEIWKEEAKTCVECGACTNICPTCHCFFLYDQKDEASMARMRVWDSCMIKDYARVAGGGNPRKSLWMRLRNRFEKKFDFFPKVANVYACTGCGRCISACPAKIDIRKVLRRLVHNA